MKITEIRVECQKMVSDGAYGNERFTVSYTVSFDGEGVDEGQTVAAALTDTRVLLDGAYDVVLLRLKRSISAGIRESLETREEREARWEQERQELRGRAQQALREERGEQ